MPRHALKVRCVVEMGNMAEQPDMLARASESQTVMQMAVAVTVEPVEILMVDRAKTVEWAETAESAESAPRVQTILVQTVNPVE
jgi:hypothetical protein